MQPEDGQLVRNVLSGDQEAFASLVSRHSTMVRAVIFSMIGANPSVDDLAQEAFLRSFKYLVSLSDQQNYGGWLCGITRRVCLDFLRSNRRPVVSLDEIQDAGADFAEPRDTELELKNDVHEAVLNMPADLRQVVLMRYVDRHSYQRMAELLGVSRATVSSRLMQAKKLLREKLGGKE
ncbi:MAG TPA: sigma-70 family RNA polymerase sigma factor [Planctomycetota bacterium]|nr:sigma-70 family RNA polymerase sigma factor [Planctomycetota bacterium]